MLFWEPLRNTQLHPRQNRNITVMNAAVRFKEIYNTRKTLIQILNISI